MKKLMMILAAFSCLTAASLVPSTSEAYWGYRHYRGPDPGPNPGMVQTYRFRPRFAMTLAGGLHFFDTFDDGGAPLTYGMLEIGGHLWVHPNLSIDLNVGTHFVTDGVDSEWGYLSIKPGIRAKFGLFYIRGALDIALTGENGAKHKRAALFGFLLGIGIRVPVGRRVRLFGEIDYQVLFADIYYMPFYGQAGVEVVF